MQRLVIRGEMTDLNNYIKEMNNNRHAGNKIKQDETERVWWACKEQRIQKSETPILCTYRFHLINKRKDEDNLLIYIKWINDGLQLAGVVPNDGPNWVHIKNVEFIYGQEGPKTEVIIE